MTKEFEELEAAARAGDAEVMRELGRRCAKGEDVEQDLCSAGEWLEKAAELGSAEERWELARRFETGDGVPKNWEKAREWQDRALELEDSFAQYCFADRCLDGDGVPRDPERAVRWYQEAAERGETNAMLSLAQLLDEGEGVEHDADEALKWYTRACSEGGNDAWPALREHLLACGEVVDEIACYCLLQHADGDEEAMLLAGQIFLQGYGMEYDEHEAVSWWEDAAEMGNVEAMERLAELYRTGHVVRDEHKAVRWLKEAAAKGSVEAMERLAELYRTGDVVRDPKLAAKWRTRSLKRKMDEDARKRNEAEDSDSPSDPHLTVSRAVQEAETGDPGAFYKLRTLLDEHAAVLQDKALLLRCVSLLGENDYRWTRCKLGEALARLAETQEELAKAVDLLSASAEQGDPRALYVLSNFVKEGRGIPRDEEQSRRLLVRSALADYAPAQRDLDVEDDFCEGYQRSDFFKDLWRRAELDNSADAMCELAEQYRRRRPEHARTLLEKARTLGSAKAVYLLARYCEEGDFGPCESPKAKEGYRKAASMGIKEAEKGLARLERKELEASPCFQELERSAADGDGDAMFQMGLMHEQRLYPDEEDDTARAWYNEALKHGRADAAEALVRLAHRRRALLRENKMAEAKEMDDLFREAVKELDRLAAVPTAHISVRQFIRKSKRTDHPVLERLSRAGSRGHTGALLELGDLLEVHDDDSREFRRALKCYGKAASLGSAEGFLKLGLLIEKGRGMTSNPRMLSFFYARAAELGSVEGACRLGCVLEAGRGCPRDAAAARESFLKAAQAGNGEACFRLGSMIERGEGVDRDLVTAADWYLTGSLAGCGEALSRLHTLVSEGSVSRADLWKDRGGLKALSGGCSLAMGGGSKPPFRIEDGLKTLATLGSAEAAFRLGCLWETKDWNHFSSFDNAALWYRTAADLGYQEAELALARLMERARKQDSGRNSAALLREAMALYRKAAERGVASAQLRLGLHLVETKEAGGVAEGADWLEKAARQGLSRAQLALAGLLEEGRGVHKDKRRAACWYDKASRQGNVEASFRLAILLTDGGDVPRDLPRAVGLLNKAAGCGIVSAMTRLGVLLENGQGAEKDPASAARWYEKAADANDPEALFHLAILLEQGMGLERNEKKARVCLGRACVLGWPEAQKRAGISRDFGFEAPEERRHLMRCYEKAQVRNSTADQLALGLLYLEGRELDRDWAKALYWFELAADNGDGEAIYRIGYCHEKGLGTPRDPARAKEYYGKAAAKGHAWARLRLQRLRGGEAGRGIGLDSVEAANRLEKLPQGAPDRER